MKTILKTWYFRIWNPLKKRTDALVQRFRKDNHDDNFNNPYIIY